MNQKQREYAIGRVEALRNKRIKALEEQYTTPAKRLSDEERADLIASGKVKPKKGKAIHEYSYVIRVFDFSPFEHDAKESPKLAGLVESERERARKVIDQIMLGDASEALELIADYEDSKPRAVKAA